MGGFLLLVFGVLFVLQDLGVWSFWGLNWYSVAFLVGGLAMVGMSCCTACQSCCDGDSCEVEAKPAKKKKK